MRISAEAPAAVVGEALDLPEPAGPEPGDLGLGATSASSGGSKQPKSRSWFHIDGMEVV